MRNNKLFYQKQRILIRILCFSLLFSGWLSPAISQEALFKGNDIKVVKEFEIQAGAKTIDLPQNKMAFIELEVRPSNGFTWEIGNKNGIIEQVTVTTEGSNIICPEDIAPGGTCTQIICLKGLAKGKASLDIEYKRKWENKPAKKAYRVNINSKGAFSGKALTPIKPPGRERPKTTKISETATKAVPSYFDWYDSGNVSSVKDQGSCGSCWAFGAIAQFESAILINDGYELDLSEQSLVSCASEMDGCMGGWWSHPYFIDKIFPGDNDAGAVYEYDHYYGGYDGYCYAPYPHHEKASAWGYTDGVSDNNWPTMDHWPSDAAVKQYIYDYGPVGTAVCSATWSSYTGGIHYPSCNAGDHIVLITGWDDSQGVWYIKNSWGSSWGEGGYIRVPYGYSAAGYCSTWLDYGTGGGGSDPLADFQASSEFVTPGSSVTFTDMSSSTVGINSWQWSFSGGSPSSYNGQNPPAITYNSQGTFDVSLQVTNYNGDVHTETKTGYITVSNDVMMHTGTVTTCTGTFYDSGGTGYYSDYESSTLTMYPESSGQKLSLSFTSFELEYDDYYCYYDYLEIYDGPSTSDPYLGQFCNTNSPGTITSTHSSGALTFVFTSDDNTTGPGWSANISCTGGTNPPVANFTASPTTVNEYDYVYFTDQSSNNPTSWSWSFPGGSPSSSSSQNPTVSYSTAGTYDVTLTTYNSAGSGTETKYGFITVQGSGGNCITSFPYNESFESGIGDFSQESGDDTDWTRQSGSTTSSSTGPSGAFDGSYYMYIESSSPYYPNNVANFRSPCFDFSSIGNPTLEFMYHMYGSAMGTLNAQVSTNGGSSWSTIWTLSGDQGNSWQSASISLGSYAGQSSVTIRFNGTTGSSYRSDMAIDMFTIQGGGGSDTQPPTTPTNLTAFNPTNNSIQLSWNASSDNVGVTGYDVYEGSNNIGTTSNTSYTATGLSQNTTYTFRVRARDAAGNVSSYSNTATETTTGGTVNYCSSQGNDYSYEWIAGVQFGSFSNNSSAAGYTDFTNQTVSLSSGNTSVSLTPGFGSSSYTEYWSVWIDFNKNGSFDDSGEQVFTGSGSSTVSGSMSIPSGNSGTTRMRVSMKYNGSPTSCETFTYGEVEDYTVSFGATSPNPITETFTSSIKVQPVPNDGNFDIVVNSKFTGDVVIQVIDISGQVVFTQTITLNGLPITIPANLNLPPGMYIVKVIIGNEVFTKQIIVK